jgi:feruloyl esterase
MEMPFTRFSIPHRLIAAIAAEVLPLFDLGEPVMFDLFATMSGNARQRVVRHLMIVGLGLSGAAHAQAPVSSEAKCAGFAGSTKAFGQVGARVTASIWHASGLILDMGREGKTSALPAHCEIDGVMQERTGEGGQHYAIRFKMRLPDQWNQRFFFQGGGGSNGVVGQAVGGEGAGNPLAIAQGYAVISQDSGHDNATNVDPKRGGNLVFGFDPIARRNYGHASLKLTSDAAHVLIKRYYKRDARYSYFYGCSKGGQEGMAFAQKYPKSFDGIVAAAPGFSLPKAAVAQAWDVQHFAALAGPAAKVSALALTYSKGDFQLVRDAILKTCDKDDGAEDGIVSAVGGCSTARVTPALRARQCSAAKDATCLSGAQVDALIASVDGPRDAKGKALYAPFAWDAGIGLDGWNVWKIGFPGSIPALNVMLGGGSLASVFTAPAKALPGSPDEVLPWQLGFNFGGDAAKIFAPLTPGGTSAWDDVAARSPDLTAFRVRGGRMIVPHGAADPVFSINDTLAWRDEVDQRSKGQADRFVRVFPVPGMNHCGGGNATDRFDAFAALVDWVEKKQAPHSLAASAGAGTPWPGRTRPLCAYPSVARYKGTGDLEKADSFSCESKP